MIWLASGKQQAQVTEPLTAAQARQKSLAVWVAPVAQVLLETKQVPSSSTEQSAMLVCHMVLARMPSLRGSDLWQSATQLSLVIWLAYAPAQVRLTKPLTALQHSPGRNRKQSACHRLRRCCWRQNRPLLLAPRTRWCSCVIRCSQGRRR